MVQSEEGGSLLSSPAPERKGLSMSRRSVALVALASVAVCVGVVALAVGGRTVRPAFAFAVTRQVSGGGRSGRWLRNGSHGRGAACNRRGTRSRMQPRWASTVRPTSWQPSPFLPRRASRAGNCVRFVPQGLGPMLIGCSSFAQDTLLQGGGIDFTTSNGPNGEPPFHLTGELGKRFPGVAIFQGFI